MASYLKRVSKKLKNPYWRAKSKYIHYFDKLPIDEKAILLESQHGKEFNGNIFRIVEYLSSDEKYKDYKIYLSCSKALVNKFEFKLEYYGIERVNILVLSSEEYFKILASAKYLINDNTFLPFFIKKEGQVYLNTWHGTPLKSLGKQIKNDAVNIGNPQRNFLTADYLLFPNEYTKKHMLDDYMLNNIANGKVVMGGYPRNDIFFNRNRRESLRKEFGFDSIKTWAYMPTFRGTAKSGKSCKSDTYMLYNLYELDKKMDDDELLFVNLHPISKSLINFDDFEHIKPFPDEIETYDFLNTVDCLITDYSSVFFDFACTRKKIVLFTFDESEYLKDRGVYLPLDKLPFPKVHNYKELLTELRSENNYDDEEFLKEFTPFDSIDSTSKLCDKVILNDNTKLAEEEIPKNGKKNVLIYAGNLAPNGVTASLRNLLSTVDTNEYNLYISFHQKSVRRYADNLFTFSDEISYLPTVGGYNLTIFDRIIKRLFTKKRISAAIYMKLNGKRVKQNFERDFGTADFDTFIQFSGYLPDQILKFIQTDKNSIIYVHSDMKQEIKARGNQRADVLKYAYKRYKHVAVVTNDIEQVTLKLGATKNNICVAKNIIPYDNIKNGSFKEAKLDEQTVCSVDFDDAMNFLNDSNTKKFITVGRFSPEKGHQRLVNAFEKFAKSHNDARLVIMGGSSYCGQYEELLNLINRKNLSDKILLLMDVSNPYAIMKKCDYFILSSYYEGFGLVLVEADIVGLPVVSTDITGPRGFMNENQGTLVENSQSGIEQGLKLLYDGKVKKLNVDYEKYNKEAIEQFEKII